MVSDPTRLLLATRRRAYRRFIEIRDAGGTGAEARAEVRRQFGLSRAEVTAIVAEGDARGWRLPRHPRLDAIERWVTAVPRWVDGRVAAAAARLSRLWVCRQLGLGEYELYLVANASWIALPIALGWAGL